MKKFGPGAIFALSTLCLIPWFSSVQAHTDTVTLKLENLGPGNNSGGVYTYPYNFSVDGATPDKSLMCYIYYDEIYVGESWTATVVPVLDASTNPATEKEFKELAFLYDVASDTKESTPAGEAIVSAAQWAAWELFDPSGFPNHTGAPNQGLVDVELIAAAFSAKYAPTSFYNNIDIYEDPTGQPKGDGTPQSFIGDPPPVPEPSSLILLGSGLLLFAGEIYRRRGTAKSIRFQSI